MGTAMDGKRLVALGLAFVDLKTIRTFQNFRPLVIRIDDLGRAEAINYHNLEYKPQRLAFHKRRLKILEMIQQRALDVVGRADENPFPRI